MHQTAWYPSEVPANDPKFIEDRFDQVLSQQIAMYGTPDLLVLTAGLWGARQQLRVAVVPLTL